MDKDKFGEGPWDDVASMAKLERLRRAIQLSVPRQIPSAALFVEQALGVVEEESGCRQSEPTLDALRAQIVLIREMLGGFTKTLAGWLENPGVGPDTDKRSALVKQAIENLSKVSTSLLTDVYYLL